jgi:carboxymethylenebutenolidase
MKHCRFFRVCFAFLFVTILINPSSYSQENITVSACCSNASIKAFTDLALDASFMIAHDEPAAFSYQHPMGHEVSFSTPDGKTGSGYFIPAKTKSKKWVLVFHEWWGLNDYIKRQSDQIHADIPEVNVLALDLYDGLIGTKREEAAALMQKTSAERIQNILLGAAMYCGKEADLFTIGWCFGGAWSNKASILLASQVKACVIYYGMPVTDTEQLKPLQADVLGIFGLQDKSINTEVVQRFRQAMQSAGKSLEVYEYDAPHAFANPSNPKYSKEYSEDAWKKSMAFLRQRL